MAGNYKAVTPVLKVPSPHSRNYICYLLDIEKQGKIVEKKSAKMLTGLNLKNHAF